MDSVFYRFNYGLIRRLLPLFLCLLFTLTGCDESISPGNSEVWFSSYDIVHSFNTSDANDRGYFSVESEGNPGGKGDVVYLERDGVFLNKIVDESGEKWHGRWTQAAVYGSFSGKGVCPRPSTTYICHQTGQRYIVSPSGQLTPENINPTELRVMSWNIGCFNHGKTSEFSLKDLTRYNALLNDFQSVFNEFNPHIIGLCEYLPSIKPRYAIRASLFPGFPYVTESRLYKNYLGKAIASSFRLFKPTMFFTLNQIGLETEVVLANGQTVLVCICHATWWSTPEVDTNLLELKMLAERYRHINRVILMGDFNIRKDREAESWELFTSAGFHKAINSSCPTTYTSVLSSQSIDNILIKGGEILSSEIYQTTPPGLDPSTPSASDANLWEQYNLSDHFPIVATIRF